MTTYNIILKAKVENANAFQGYYIGVPSPMTAISFSEYLKLELLKEFKKNEYITCLNEYDPNYPIDSFNFSIVKNVSFGFDGLTFKISEGHEKFSNSSKSTKLDSINTPIVDVRHFSSNFFVIFQIEIKEPLVNQLEVEYIKKILCSILNRSNFSGGKIFEVFEKNIQVVENSEIIDTYENYTGFIKSHLKDSKNIWFIIEQFSEQYNSIFNDSFPDFKNMTPIDKYLNIIKKNKKQNKDKEYQKILDGFYIPSLLGYRFLNDIQPASGRFKYRNFYGEPVLGIVRCRSIDSYLVEERPKHDIFWNFTKNNESINIIAKNKINLGE